MPHDSTQYLTKEGREKLVEELENLRNVKRAELAERIKSAKELGDLSENAEYSTAKDEQNMVENRIAELEALLKEAVMVEENNTSNSVHIGSVVVVKVDGAEIELSIVGSNEANPEANHISYQSPVAEALLGAHVGQTVTVVAPKGEVAYKILDIK